MPALQCFPSKEHIYVDIYVAWISDFFFAKLFTWLSSAPLTRWKPNISLGLVERIAWQREIILFCAF